MGNVSKDNKILKALIRFLVFEDEPVEGFVQRVDEQGELQRHDPFLLSDDLVVLYMPELSIFHEFKTLAEFANFVSSNGFNRIGSVFTKTESPIYKHFEKVIQSGGAA